MSAAGRILADEVNAGSGFAVSPRIALTAAHVVNGKSAQSLRFSLAGASPIQVEHYEEDGRLDAAVLHLGADVRETFRVGPVMRGQRWEVDTQTLENDPLLTGEVTVERRSVGHHGTVADYIQLLVDQDLQDFSGYSGSPVVSEDGVAVGMLVEQLPIRLQGRTSEPRPSTNVLFAAPVIEIMSRFALDNQVIAAPEGSDLSKLASISQLGRVTSRGVGRRWINSAPFFHDPGTLVDQLAFSPNGRLLVTAGTDKAVKVWDLAQDDELVSLQHEEKVRQLAFSGDGELLATVSGQLVRVWRVRDEPDLVWSKEHDEVVAGLALSPDGRMLATAVPRGTSRIWDLEGSGSWDLPEPRYQFSVAFDPEGKRLAACSFIHDRLGLPRGLTRMWRFVNGEFRRPMHHREGESVRKVWFSPQGEWLVSIVKEGTLQQPLVRHEPETVWVRDSRTGAPVGCVRHDDEVSRVAVSFDDRLLVTSSTDKTVQLWEIGSGKAPVAIRFDHIVVDVALSYDRAVLAVAVFDNSVHVYDLGNRSGPELLTHPEEVRGVAFSRTGLLAAASDAGVWTWRSTPV